MNLLFTQKNKSYFTIGLLGKSLKLDIKYRENPIVEMNQKENKIELFLPKKYKTMKNVDIVNMAIEKLYDEVAEKEIADCMEEMRIILGFSPEDYQLKRMDDTFCKCAKRKVLYINPDIVRYNRRVIEATLLQAFCKIKYQEGTKTYKEALLNAINIYEQYTQKVLKYQEGLRRVS